MRSLVAGLCLLASVLVAAVAVGSEGPPERPDTKRVMFIGNNWAGTADIVDPETYQRLARVNLIPDKEERLRRSKSVPSASPSFLAFRDQSAEGQTQLTDTLS